MIWADIKEEMRNDWQMGDMRDLSVVVLVREEERGLRGLVSLGMLTG